MNVACPVCNSTLSRLYPVHDLLLGGLGVWDFGRCAACGHGALTPAPSGAELAAFYGSLYTPENLASMRAIDRSGFERLLRRRRARAVVRALGDRPPTRIVDVGAGLGGWAADLHARWPSAEVIGVELSEVAANDAAARPGVTIVKRPFDACGIEPGSAQLVSMNHYLEHDPDPAAAVARAADLLAPGGVLVVELPWIGGFARSLFGRWYWGHLPPQHLHLPSKESLSRLLRGAGLEPGPATTTGYPFQAVVALVLAIRFTAGTRSRYANNWLVRGPAVVGGLLLLPVALAFDVLVAPFLGLAGWGDVLLQVAHKPGAPR